jgi:hypothetical protein
MPCCWTICGNSGTTACRRFCTCTCAISGSVPLAKVSVIPTEPSEVLLEDM